MVSFAVVFILQLLKTVGKKKKRRNHPQQSTRIIFEYFRSWQTLVILAKRPYCDHPTTILSCRITLVVKFASISIPIVSKSFGNKKKRRNHPQHWVTVIFEYFRIWQTEAVLPKRPYCDHPTTIPSSRISPCVYPTGIRTNWIFFPSQYFIFLLSDSIPPSPESSWSSVDVCSNPEGEQQSCGLELLAWLLWSSVWGSSGTNGWT